MPRISRPRAITNTGTGSFVTLQVWPQTRDRLNKVAAKRNVTLCLLIESLAIRAERESFRDGTD